MSRMDWAITCDHHELPPSRSLARRLRSLPPPPATIQTEQDSLLLQLPPELLTAIFRMLHEQARWDFARTCRTLNEIHNYATTRMVLSAMTPKISFYNRLFARRPRLAKLVLPSVVLYTQCRHVDTAMVAMRELSPAVELELCDAYAVQMPACFADVRQGRKWHVTPFCEFFRQQIYQQVSSDFKSPLFFFYRGSRNYLRDFSRFPLSAEECSLALSLAVAGDTKSLCKLVELRKKIGTFVYCAPISCQGVRRQTVALRWVWRRPLRRLPMPKRVRVDDYVSDIDDSDDCEERTADNETDDDDDDVEDDNIPLGQTLALDTAVAYGTVVHCECGRCERAQLSNIGPMIDEFDPANDRIAPRCDCIHGLVSREDWAVGCMCNKSVMSQEILVILATAAVARPAVCRQPVYRRLAFYPLLQSPPANG